MEDLLLGSSQGSGLRHSWATHCRTSTATGPSCSVALPLSCSRAGAGVQSPLAGGKPGRSCPAGSTAQACLTSQGSSVETGRRCVLCFSSRSWFLAILLIVQRLASTFMALAEIQVPKSRLCVYRKSCTLYVKGFEESHFSQPPGPFPNCAPELCARISLALRSAGPSIRIYPFTLSVSISICIYLSIYIYLYLFVYYLSK